MVWVGRSRRRLTRVESVTGVTSPVFGDLIAGSDGSQQRVLTDLFGPVTETADGLGRLTGLTDYSNRVWRQRPPIGIQLQGLAAKQSTPRWDKGDSMESKVRKGRQRTTWVARSNSQRAHSPISVRPQFTT